jgi:hypothetical protein
MPQATTPFGEHLASLQPCFAARADNDQQFKRDEPDEPYS